MIHKRFRFPISFLLALLGSVIIFSVLFAGKAKRQQPMPALDFYAMMETPQDLPGSFTLSKNSREQPFERHYYHSWNGSLYDPNQPAGINNPPMDLIKVRMTFVPDPEATRTRAFNFDHYAVTPEEGSYSGAHLGDRSYLRGTRGDKTNVGLWVLRKYVCMDIRIVRRHPFQGNCQPEVENLAKTLIERVDAAALVAEAAEATTLVRNHNLVSKRVNGVTLVHVREYADAVGVAAEVDFKQGLVTLTQNGHTLKLKIGRKDAELDGKQVTLPFPALRHGKDQVYCPVDTLRQLEG